MTHQNGAHPLAGRHHNELKACDLLRTSVQQRTSLVFMQDFTRQFWQSDLKFHIAEEEWGLIPLLMNNDSLRPFGRILHNDHQFLERIYERSQDGHLSYRILELFAENLEQHLQFEETVVLEAMMEQLPGRDCAGLFYDDSDPAGHIFAEKNSVKWA